MKTSNFAGVLRWSGGTIVLRSGQTIDDNHPLALERPELFDDGAPQAELQTQPTSPPVERATQAPGEGRNIRIPRGTASGQ